MKKNATLLCATALAMLCSAPCFGIGCDEREYAQYKDQAATSSGQSVLAEDYCRFELRRKTASDLGRLAAQYGQQRDLKQATVDEAGSLREMGKIRDALTAAKATKAWTIIAACSK